MAGASERFDIRRALGFGAEGGFPTRSVAARVRRQVRRLEIDRFVRIDGVAYDEGMTRIS